jgi:hypothetical protein
MAVTGGASVRGGEVVPERAAALLAAGSAVEVRNRFDGHWARGFEVVAVVDAGYRIRRLSDGLELPSTFSGDDVRAKRDRKRGMWWY